MNILSFLVLFIIGHKKHFISTLYVIYDFVRMVNNPEIVAPKTKCKHNKHFSLSFQQILVFRISGRNVIDTGGGVSWWAVPWLMRFLCIILKCFLDMRQKTIFFSTIYTSKIMDFFWRLMYRDQSQCFWKRWSGIRHIRNIYKILRSDWKLQMNPRLVAKIFSFAKRGSLSSMKFQNFHSASDQCFRIFQSH